MPKSAFRSGQDRSSGGTQGPVRELSVDDIFDKVKSDIHVPRQSYLAMYSSWWGGITKEPGLMMVPVDDHLVHRGDGVFEAMKCVDHKIYCLDRHLDRLQVSAERIGLSIPAGRDELREICRATVRAAGANGSDCLLRLFVARGPGSFSINPYDTIDSQIYLVVVRHRDVSGESYERGVTCEMSSFPVKGGFFANVKSCNYLQNVLMKKEAVDAGVDYVISRDESGNLAEGATENLAIVSDRGEFLMPGFERTLRGVTALRALELASDRLVSQGLIVGVQQRVLQVQDVLEAREVLLLSTTIDCLAVRSFAGKTIGGGVAGPVAKTLRALLKEDMRTGPLAVPI